MGVASDPDDEALSWEGDDESRRARTPGEGRRARADRAPDAVTPPAPASDPTAADAEARANPAADAEPADEPGGLSTVALVALGVFAGVYLLYTVGWVLGAVGMQGKALFLIPGPVYAAAMWTAVLAPALWFAMVLLLTRHSRDWVRLVLLVVGALLLVPWPFVIAGGGGAL